MSMQDDQTGPAAPTPPAAAPPPEPRPGRKAAWIAMGAVALALVLLWSVPELMHTHEGDGSITSFDGSADPDDTSIVGKPAPLDFTIADINGVDVKLASFKGKVVLLNFWATWCEPCKAEIPDLVELQAEHAGELVVLGFLSLDPVSPATHQFIADFKMNYPILNGNGREDVEQAFGPMWGLPTTILIGRDGRVAAKHSGYMSREQFEQEIKALL